jgi:hypothetical protein
MKTWSSLRAVRPTGWKLGQDSLLMASIKSDLHYQKPVNKAKNLTRFFIFYQSLPAELWAAGFTIAPCIANRSALNSIRPACKMPPAKGWFP